MTNLHDTESKTDSRERRRMPRLNLTHELFRLSLNGKIFSVADLSEHGLGLRILDAEDLGVLTLGRMIEGSLNIWHEKYQVQLKVMRLGRDLVGCEFVAPKGDLQNALTRALDPSHLGKTLRPMPANDRGLTWYHAASGTDLLMWRGVDGRYRKISIFVLGNFVQWEEEKGVSTGFTASSYEPSENRGALHFETVLLEADPKADLSKIKIAKELITSSNLPEDLKTWCIRHLQEKTAV